MLYLYLPAGIFAAGKAFNVKKQEGVLLYGPNIL